MLAIVVSISRSPSSLAPTPPTVDAPAATTNPMKISVEDVNFRDATYENSYDNWWMAEEGIFFGANTSNVAIETNGDPPGDNEFALLDRVFEKEKEINEEIKTAFFEKYQEVRSRELEKMSRELGPETANIILPEIRSASDVWRIGGYSVVEMPIQKDETFRFRILLLCNWDDQYGLQARYVDGEFQGLEKGQY